MQNPPLRTRPRGDDAQGGIQLQVLNQRQEPAFRAWVEAYPPGSEKHEWEGSTGEDGRVKVDVPDGTWTLVVSSEADHFVIVREGVTAPGSLTLDTTGTVPVDVTVRRLDGQALSTAIVSFERFTRGYNKVGDVNSEGALHADLTPGTYCGLAASYSERYYLNRPGVTVSGPTSVLFDASQLGTGQVVMRTSSHDEIGLSMFPQPLCRLWSPVLDLADGISATLSAGRYEFHLDFELDTCTFAYRAKDARHDLISGTVTTLWVGGTHVASIHPAQGTYRPGSWVYIDSQVVDGYGNRLGQIGCGGEELVLSHLVVRDPHGSIAHESDCWWLWDVDCSFFLPRESPHGRYEVEWTLDTGPLEGVLRATTHFSVEGEPVTPRPTPRITATPTRTETPTPTPTPTPTTTPIGPWLAWADSGPLLLPASAMVQVRYGNVQTPATLVATLSGPAVFQDDSHTVSIDITDGNGAQTLRLRPAAGAERGATFTLEVTLAGLRLERSGTIAWEAYLPVIRKHAP